MKFGDFFIVPESQQEDTFIDEEIKYLLKISFREREKIKSTDEYQKLVEQRYNAWLEKNLSYG